MHFSTCFETQNYEQNGRICSCSETQDYVHFSLYSEEQNYREKNGSEKQNYRFYDIVEKKGLCANIK